MAKNDNISSLDASQAFKRTLDGNHDAIRVVQAVNTEMEIAISAEEGDSIVAVSRSRTIVGEQTCSDIRRICRYTEGGSIEVSADGVSWIEINPSILEMRDICAMMIRVTGCVVVGQS